MAAMAMTMRRRMHAAGFHGDDDEDATARARTAAEKTLPAVYEIQPFNPVYVGVHEGSSSIFGSLEFNIL